MRGLICAMILFAGSAAADVLVPTRTLRAKEIITESDIMVKPASVPGALSRASDAVGQEARVTLYAGRPFKPGDIGPPALVVRNEMVVLIFARNGLNIVTEGRALDRAAAGETVRVMNVSSRTTVTGLVRADGTIEVR